MKKQVNMIDEKKFENSIIYYVLIACACVNLLEKGSLIFCAIALYKVRFKYKFDANMISITLLTSAVVISSIIFYSFYEIVKAANFFFLYLIGYNGYLVSNDKIKYINRTVFAIFTGFGANIIITYIYNMNIHRIAVRTLYSFWTHELISVTLIGLLSSVVIGYSFYCLFCSKKIYIKIISLIILIIALLINFSTATRTPIIMLCIVYSVMSIIYASSLGKRKALKALLAINLAFIVIFLTYQFNAFGIKEHIQQYPIFLRFKAEGLYSSRLDITKQHLKYMWRYLWGGNNIKTLVTYSAHNYLQEGYDLYGIFAFIALIAKTVHSIRNIFTLVSIKQKQPQDFLFISMYLSIYIQMCMEPVFSGYPILFWSMLLIDGMATAYLEDIKQLKSYITEGFQG